MKHIAIILSGCGVFDGAEIHEAVLTLLHVELQGGKYQCFAPNIAQMHVINHRTGEVAENESRNVLTEAARIARGEIKDLAELDANDFDALILPGGFGAAKNLSDFAVTGAECRLNDDVESACKAFANAGKAVGYICISPAMIPKIYQPGTKLTIGNDEDTASAITSMGGEHINCPVDEFIVDEQHKVVSTPAYMLAGSITQANAGISKLVKKVFELS
ncbi:isoprenoid biosynthesis glyoxalase ElbB [Thalassotalea sp. HSM 43]|uniref:isoprenoid biosynthesis glyoxalase ElbB n=1 Tax=Thalassotalea sp. HSM 43 TaxID=2552945 RepID=UPI00108046B9|nr:isoprenoid biosynthesis glyoxalase ElbB [Thalassotalea sp. HSM 43]QBY03585.1 isoprenoid biosynthesis glyoxalase ElbB [Thalassotalea sp. HSM 43]